jgi:hypothetical protein
MKSRAIHQRIDDNNQQGIALVLLATLLVVLALTAGVVVSRQEQQAVLQPRLETQATLNIVKDALVAYQRHYSRLPCPAALARDASSPQYGVPVDDAALLNLPCNTILYPVATTVANLVVATPGSNVHIGGVPTQALAIPQAYAEDAWGNRIYYAMTTDFADKSGFHAGGSGAIAVKSSVGASSTIASGVAFLLHAPGQNAAGARKAKSGVIGKPCISGDTAGTDEYGNCLSAIEGSVTTEPVFYYSKSYNLSGAAANRFDDMLAYAEPDQLARASKRDCAAASYTLTWEQSGNQCSHTQLFAGLSHGATVAISPASGSATAQCNNGRVVAIGPLSCP